MSKDKLPDDVREHLEALLAAGIQVADLQYDDTSRLGMLAIVESLAKYFDCELTVLTAEISEDGEITVNLVNEDEDDEDSEDDDQGLRTVH